MKIRARRRALAALAAAAIWGASAPIAGQAPELPRVDSDTFGGLQARSIGPAVMSGRVAAIDAAAGDRLTIWVGSAGGGVWTSSDGGLRFKAVFDRYNQSIGAVAIDPIDPRTVWVGTGESWTRNSVSVGDGVYKTTDGGDTWIRAGLADSERIARIAVNPRDRSTILVCALGHLFDDHPERGVFRTRDGGKTWEKVLYVAPDTGCADLAMNPDDPNILYAGMWQVRRRPDFFVSGGPRSGLFRSTDGGTSWKAVKAGIPTSDLGRIAIAVAPSKPSVVYATIEATHTALYRSDDRGETWKEVNSSSAVTQRPFYFSRLVVDPTTDARVYKCGLSLSVSDDGGKTFSTVGVGGVHGDVHDVWVNPKNAHELVIGTDGGAYVSRDRGGAWRFIASLPLGQFYHVSYDLAWPYNVYGGLQDNSTWYGPSRRSRGIANKHWQSLTGGDGFWAFVDPHDSDIIYDEYQGGNLFRIRRSTLESKDIKPSPRQGEPKYRFNWNTPIHIGPTSGRLYYGAQFLFRSADHGESWERLSPDLTTNDPAKQKQDTSGGLTLDNSTAENHCTIFTIAESPKSANVIWVGTDDGNVQVTRDGGRTWTNVVGNAPGLPKSTWVTSVEPSHFDEAVALATFDGHMTGDMKPYVYRTADYGRSWQPLATGDLRGYAHVVKEDPVNHDLLFLGTEFGLWISIDGGRQWVQFTAGLPSVAVRDLAIHPRDHDLLIATHGRALYIVDDITPLRHLSRVLTNDAAFLESRPSPMVLPVFEFGFGGDAEYVGRSPEAAAFITYYLKRRQLIGEMKLEILDERGTVVATLPASRRRGINRVEWSMRLPAPRIPPGVGLIPSTFALMGPRVAEGTYTVRLATAQQTYASHIRLVPDPRTNSSADERALQRRTLQTLSRLLERLAYVVDAIVDARDQARDRAAKLEATDALRGQMQQLADELERQRTALVSSKQGEGISGEEKLREELAALYGNVNGFVGRPTTSQVARMELLGKNLEAAVSRFDQTCARELASANPQLERRNLKPLRKLTVEEGK